MYCRIKFLILIKNNAFVWNFPLDVYIYRTKYMRELLESLHVQKASQTKCKLLGGELKQWINDVFLLLLTLHCGAIELKSLATHLMLKLLRCLQQSVCCLRLRMSCVIFVINVWALSRLLPKYILFFSLLKRFKDFLALRVTEDELSRITGDCLYQPIKKCYL